MMYIMMNPVLFLVKSLTTDIFPLCKSVHIKSVLISFGVNIPGILFRINFTVFQFKKLSGIVHHHLLFVFPLLSILCQQFINLLL